MRQLLGSTPLSLLVLTLVLGTCVGAWPDTACAQNEFATVGLFLGDVRNRACDIDGPVCDENALITGELYLPYYAYVCVFNGDRTLGVAGLQFALRYDSGASSGVDVWEWNNCATFEFAEPGFPASRTGNAVTWDRDNDCQRRVPTGGEGVTAIAGYLYITAYSDDLLEIEASPARDKVYVADCEAAESAIKEEQLGFLGFSDDGNTTGKLPCSGKVLENTTWSGVKRTGGSGDN